MKTMDQLFQSQPCSCKQSRHGYLCVLARMEQAANYSKEEKTKLITKLERINRFLDNLKWFLHEDHKPKMANLLKLRIKFINKIIEELKC